MLTAEQPGVESSSACSRRSLLTHALASGLATALPLPALPAPRPIVDNVTGLYGVAVAGIDVPQTVEHVADRISATSAQVAVGGGRYSMGGQVAIADGLHLDMRALNRLVWIRPHDRRVRVQAGMRWRDLQDVLDPLGLAVKTMQSYANFSIGGSVSVNVHGRHVGHGPIGNTVQSLQLVLADGHVVEASATQNGELFRAAIGGYGAVGVITEVELALADNVRIQRVVTQIKLADYARHFADAVLGDDDSVLHNADLLPPDFDAAVSVSWCKTAKALTETARLIPRGQRHPWAQNAIWAMTELAGGQRLRRSVVHPLLLRKPVVQWLNHETSRDVAELEPRTRRISTYVLQEYFVPTNHFLSFVDEMAAVLRRHDAAVLNVSVRHSPADTVSLLPWAKQDVFSFVLYHKQRTHAAARKAVGRWTRALIDLALDHGGRYYLPYQLHATREQFERAYPEVESLRRIKRAVDPAGRFSNAMWAKYL